MYAPNAPRCRCRTHKVQDSTTQRVHFQADVVCNKKGHTTTTTTTTTKWLLFCKHAVDFVSVDASLGARRHHSPRVPFSLCARVGSKAVCTRTARLGGVCSARRPLCSLQKWYSTRHVSRDSQSGPDSSSYSYFYARKGVSYTICRIHKIGLLYVVQTCKL